VVNYRRALVTGGAGFIGSHLAHRLLREGLQVVVLDNLSMGEIENVPAGAEFIHDDIRADGAMQRALDQVDVVFHLAARVSIRASVQTYQEDADVNLMGTLNVLRACAGRGIAKFVYASSMAVYADAPGPVPLTEDHHTLPLSPYGVSKLAGENYVRLVATQSGFKAVSLRYFNTYGPGQAYTPYVGVITIFVQRLVRGEPPIIFGDGLQCRDFVFVGDVVEATWLAMLQDVDGLSLNVGSGRGRTVNEIASLLCSRLRPDIAPKHAPAHAGELRNSIADISRAERVLGYRPKADLEEQLDDIISWNQQAA